MSENTHVLTPGAFTGQLANCANGDFATAAAGAPSATVTAATAIPTANERMREWARGAT